MTKLDSDANDDDWTIELQSEFDGFKNRDKVILMQLPAGLTENGLENMCQAYGKIKHLKWPENKPFAFVKFESTAEADTIVRRFRNDHADLDIVVDFAKEKTIDKEIKPPSEDNEFSSLFVKKAMVNNDENPLRNVLQMDQRKIKGPFCDPSDVQLHESLVRTSDYRILYLKFADPRKEFLWDSNDEVNIEFETKNQRKIVHGRAILISKLEALDDISNSPKTLFSLNSDLLFSIPKHICMTCGQLADKICKNCQEAYCSLECHAAKHKKKNHETNETNAAASTAPIPKQIKAENIDRFVKITAVLNHRMVFVRPAEQQHEEAFVRMMCDTVRYAKEADNLKSLPSIGSLVLAKFDYYQRALVLRHLDDVNVVVVFIDYGNIEVRDFRKLKVMPDVLKKKKRFARRIKLSKIDNDIMNNKALLYLYNLMAFGTELKIKIEANDDAITAELMASDKWVNSMVQLTNIDDIVVPKVHSIVNLTYFKEFWEEHGKRVDCKKLIGKEVIILDNSQLLLSDLTFIETDNLKQFRHNDRRIQNICNYLYTNDECYTPQNEECCVVQRNGRWYRAYCLEVCFDGFVTFQFIDYGNIQLIEVNDIRPIPTALLFDCFTITADCLSDYGIETIASETLVELKSKYKPISQWKIERMEERPKKTHYDESSEIFAWLQNINQFNLTIFDDLKRDFNSHSITNVYHDLVIK